MFFAFSKPGFAPACPPTSGIFASGPVPDSVLAGSAGFSASGAAASGLAGADPPPEACFSKYDERFFTLSILSAIAGCVFLIASTSAPAPILLRSLKKSLISLFAFAIKDFKSDVC